MKHWIDKFACALRGTRLAVRGESSYWVHLPAMMVVLSTAAWLHATLWHWCAILFAITIVISCEMLNTAIERVVKMLHPERHPAIGEALDISSAAVLVAAAGASMVGILVFLDLLQCTD
ncbi:MAG: diacylglycerol kinase [Pirellulaceae bacterium]